jgi:hypothetical protein
MRSSVRLVASIVLAAVIFAPCSLAQTNLDGRVSIDVESAAPKDVFGAWAKRIGCELSIAQEIQKPVTIRLSNVTFRTALDALAESLECRWTIQGKILRVEPAGKGKSGSGGVVGGVPGGGGGGAEFKQRLDRKTPPNFRFDNVPVREVMDALGKIADLELRMEGPAADQRVTLDLSDRTILAAIKAIRQQNGLGESLVVGASLPGTEKKIYFKMGPQKKSNQ